MQTQSKYHQVSDLNMPKTVNIAYGDGIGPEIMTATLRILDASGANLHFEPILIGQQLYEQGILSGITSTTWDQLRENKILLKAPITTPQGGGYKSLNVTLRKTLGLFANIRPCKSYTPYIKSSFPKLDLVIIRENEEDLYAGIEHQQTPEVVQCLKLVSRSGCEKIIRYAFEYARANKRKKVTCMTKDNIMKQTDGLFHKVFDEIALEYPEISHEHAIIDIGAARIASNPEMFDVVVTMNLYGDILSDIVAQISGSVGLSGSANIGKDFAMFEAVHGSAPDIAGQDIANPSGLIQAACMMLIHLGKPDKAWMIQNALNCTIEDGIHTADIFNPSSSKVKVGTQAFADAVIARLGKEAQTLRVEQVDGKQINIDFAPKKEALVNKDLVGIDIFLDWDESGRDPEMLGKLLTKMCEESSLKLKMITNRGVKVYPHGIPETFCTDHWRCRFVSRHSLITPGGDNMPEAKPISYLDVIDILRKFYMQGLEVIKTENLYIFDGKRGYSLGQGE